jgi:hypothetical protein
VRGREKAKREIMDWSALFCCVVVKATDTKINDECVEE